LGRDNHGQGLAEIVVVEIMEVAAEEMEGPRHTIFLSSDDE